MCDKPGFTSKLEQGDLKVAKAGLQGAASPLSGCGELCLGDRVPRLLIL